MLSDSGRHERTHPGRWARHPGRWAQRVREEDRVAGLLLMMVAGWMAPAGGLQAVSLRIKFEGSAERLY